MKGWISLHRKILDNPILTRNKEYSRLEAFIWFLLNVNHKPSKILIGNDIVALGVGERITSIKKLEHQFNWGNTKVRNYLKLLQNDNMIKFETNTQYTKIHVINYQEYQKNQHTNNTPTTNKQQTNNKRTHTNNNVLNNDKNNVNNRKVELYNNLKEDKYKKKYGKDMLNEFYSYWTEPNKSNTKIRIEEEKYFDVSRRLSTWNKNNFSKNNKEDTAYKLDSTGFPMAWCSTCQKADSYRWEEIKGDSRCCYSKMTSTDPKKERVDK